MIPETTPHKYAHHLSYWFDHKSREYGQIMPQSQTTDQPLHREEETPHDSKKNKTTTTSSLFLGDIIVKLERTISTTQQSKDQTSPTHNGNNNKQWVNNNRTITFVRTITLEHKARCAPFRANLMFSIF